MDSQAHLDGLTVGIPASRRATETARLVQRWGGSPLVGPTVRELTATSSAGVVQATKLIVEAPLQWSVHLTGVGTKRWFDLADQASLLNPLVDKLRGAEVIARGQKTKAALAKVDIQPAWVPEGETSQEIIERLTPKLGLGGLRVQKLDRHAAARRLPKPRDSAQKGTGRDLVGLAHGFAHKLV